MKKALLSIAAMALLSSQGFAQIVLKDTSFNNPVGTTDSLRYVIDGFNSTNVGTHVNQAYTNHTWDLLENNYVIGTTYTNWKVISYTSATPYTYSAIQMDTLNHRTVSMTTAPVFTYPAGILTNLAATGITEHGRRIQAAGYSISALPGANPNDSVKIFAQDAMYYQTTIGNVPTSRTRLKFPATFSTTSPVNWQNNYQDTVKATITYGTTYNGDTIQVKETVTEQYSIEGWGKMMIKLPAGNNSVYFNVLQVRVMSQVSDSFFVEGVPIPTLTLGQLGVTQGQVRLMYYDEYYRPDYVVPFAHIRFTDANRNATMQRQSLMHVQHWNPAGVEGLVTTMSNIEVYPNPVKGGLVNININGSQKDWNYSVISMNGQSVKAGKLNVNGGKAQVELPANLPAGTYQMLLENGEQTIVKPLSIVE